VPREFSSAGRLRRLAVGVALLACAVPVGISAGASAATSQISVAQALRSAKAPTSELKRTRTIDFRGAQIVRYQQEVSGVPVLGGEVVVVNGAAAAPSVVTDASAAKSAAPATPRVSSARAIAIARAATGARGNRTAPRAGLAIDPRHGGALVRRVVLASKRPLKDFEVLVDAGSGSVLAKRNLLQDATGHAKLFTPNPVATNGGYSGIGTAPSADHNDHDTAKLTSLRVAVDLKFLKSGQHCLVGKYVDSRLGHSANKVCRKSLNWNGVTRSSNQFEALMTYYHISNIQNYFRLLGFTGGADVHPNRQTTLADAIPDDNSFYSPATHKITYGTGGVDDAEDGDVITHEYGHSIQDAQDHGFGSGNQAGGLGEGFGDFMSAVNTAITPGLPSYGAAEYCIFDWDGVGGYGGPGVAPCGRLADGSDGTNTYAQALVTCNFGPDPPEIHCLGEVWSHGLIDLLNNILPEGGAPPILNDVLFSQFTYADNESFGQAVNGLVAADNTIYGGTHKSAICTEMETNRGINASSCP